MDRGSCKPPERVITFWRMSEIPVLLINLHQVNHADDKGQESLSTLLAEDAAILRDAGLFDIGGHSDERNG